MSKRTAWLGLLAAATPALANYGPPSVMPPTKVPLVLLGDYAVDLVFLMLGLMLIGRLRQSRPGRLLWLGLGVAAIGVLAATAAFALVRWATEPPGSLAWYAQHLLLTHHLGWGVAGAYAGVAFVLIAS